MVVWLLSSKYIVFWSLLLSAEGTEESTCTEAAGRRYSKIHVDSSYMYMYVVLDRLEYRSICGRRRAAF
jgi:hypothetical protein